MSVTFSAEPGPIVGHRVFCVCDEQGLVFEDYDDAAKFFDAVRNGSEEIVECVDEDCVLYGPYLVAVEEHPSPEVNMSNANAGRFLRHLGFAFENGIGSCDAPTFQRRIAEGRAVAVDADMAYRLDAVAEVAEFCVRTCRTVTWG